jgi:hypothetical protein
MHLKYMSCIHEKRKDPAQHFNPLSDDWSYNNLSKETQLRILQYYSLYLLDARTRGHNREAREASWSDVRGKAFGISKIPGSQSDLFSSARTAKILLFVPKKISIGRSTNRPQKMFFPSRMSSVVADYSTPLNELVPPGVVTGDDLLVLLEHARANGYALPAVNCTRYVHLS